MTLTEARDWAILALAALVLVQALVVIVVGLTILRLAKDFRKRAGGIMDSVANTMDNLQTASWFLSRATAWPVIRVVSLGAGMRRTLQVLARVSRKKKGGKR